MFIETAIGVAVAVIMMIAIAQLVAVIANQRRNVAQVRLATREVANAMERVMAASWDDLSADEPPEVSLSPAAEQRLDEPRLSVVITGVEADAKQVRVQIDWLNRAGVRVDPIRVIGWKHQRRPHAPLEESGDGED